MGGRGGGRMGGCRVGAQVSAGLLRRRLMRADAGERFVIHVTFGERDGLVHALLECEREGEGLFAQRMRDTNLGGVQAWMTRLLGAYGRYADIHVDRRGHDTYVMTTTIGKH